MAFNSADTAAFKNVWVFCEQRQGVMMPTTFELISEGRKLANELGVELCGILLGDNVDGIAAELGEYGADKVYVYNSPLLKDFTTDAYTKVIVEAVEELKPEVLLFGAFTLSDYIAVTQFHQVPRFSYETVYDSRLPDQLVHKTLFFTVVQQNEPCLAAPAVREIPGAQLPGKEYLAACLQGG